MTIGHIQQNMGDGDVGYAEGNKMEQVSTIS